jgi:DNA polymerase-4
MDRIILHVDMDAFFASVEELCDPRMRGKPVMVCGNRDTRTVVAAANYEARKYGISAGTPLGIAKMKCPHGIFVEGDPEKYVCASLRMNDVCREFSPVVERYSIDESFLDCTGTAHFFGGPVETGRQLKQRIRDRFGLTISVGIGPNKTLAKMASKLEKPDGLTLITEADLPERIFPMPVKKLFGVGSRTTDKLRRLGVETIGQLAAVPADILRRLLGVYGLYLHEASNGRDPTPVVPEAETPEPKSVGNSYTLLRDSDDDDHLLRILLGLSSKVGRRLRADGQAGRTVTVTIRLHDFTTVTRARTLPVHVDRDQAIYEAARGIVLRERAKPKFQFPVRLLGISVSGLATEQSGSQDWLMDRGYFDKYDGMIRVADRIRDRYGERVLTWGRLVRREADPQLVSSKIGGLSWERRSPGANGPVADAANGP